MYINQVAKFVWHQRTAVKVVLSMLSAIWYIRLAPSEASYAPEKLVRFQVSLHTNSLFGRLSLSSAWQGLSTVMGEIWTQSITWRM